MVQVEKLKVIWYKVLHKMNMADDYRTTLLDLGIFHSKDDHDYLDKPNLLQRHSSDGRIMSPIDLSVEALSQGIDKYQDNTAHSNNLNHSRTSLNFLRKKFFKSQLGNSGRTLQPSGKVRGGKAGEVSAKLRAKFNLKLTNLIMRLRTEFDFYVPFSQIDLLDPNMSPSTIVTSKSLNGKWLNGLEVTLEDREVGTIHHINQLLNEIKVLKFIRHPSVQMHIGVTYFQYRVSN
jgi:hypothetical protein